LLEPFFVPHHPAILRLIETTIKNAHKHNIWVGICGELAADRELTRTFVEMGIDYEEKAFYDILVAVAEKFHFTFPDEKNIALAKAIHEKVKDKSKYSDWSNRADIRAEMQVDIILLLAQAGYPPTPPEIYEKVYASVIEQAENFKKYSD
jgi:type I restriction enzyme R subunit